MNRMSRMTVGLALLIGLAVASRSGAETSVAMTSGIDLDAINRFVRPQDDFYQFANGAWLDRTSIPPIYSSYSVYQQVNERVEQALQGIIEAAAANPGPAGSESRMVGDLFTSWMDEASINSLGVSAVGPELAIVDGVTDRKSLLEAFARLDRIGVGGPIRFNVDQDLRKSTVHVAYVNQGGLTLPDRDYYLDTANPKFDKARQALPAYIRSLLKAAGRDEVAAAAIVDLETAIARAQWDKVKNRDNEATYNPHTIDELGRLAPNLDWMQFLTALGAGSADRVIVGQPDYFQALDGMIESRPLEEWKNYLAYRVMDARAADLDSTTAAIRFDFRNRTLNGQQQERERWKGGVSIVDRLVGQAVGKLYVAQYFPPEAKTRMIEMVRNVTATLDASLADLDWMTPATRQKAREKLARFTPKIGYPDVWLDYSGMEIIRGDHAGNVRRANEWEHARRVARLGKPVDRTEWGMTPQTVNAYYNPSLNEIVFPAARLQPPFFQLEADDAINYGAVGGVIGHEISHGFDDEGSRFDGDGNMADWWTEADRAAFEERTKALVAQYDRFSPIEGMQVNGAFTLGENIGDLSGVAMAYRAYIASLGGKEAPVIDGFTGPQRFFIGYAMSRKGKMRDEQMIQRLASDPHAPLEFRVTGPYRNIDAFHDAFGTKEGDGMWLAPEERVRLW
ncbi:MAG: M13 family metallopeptidase [Candidatus Eisenbacteria bacterium]|nr:M13 family metallopeptidase [Candidatus Eisenbacteria bacterium]